MTLRLHLRSAVLLYMHEPELPAKAGFYMQNATPLGVAFCMPALVTGLPASWAGGCSTVPSTGSPDRFPLF